VLFAKIPSGIRKEIKHIFPIFGTGETKPAKQNLQLELENN